MRRRISFASLIAVVVVILVGLAAGPLMSKVENPPYTVERTDGSIELRTYPSLTVATITVSDTRGAAIQKGFRALADYIFGANDRARKIEMTAPVLQGRSSEEPSDQVDKRDEWTVRFVMPRSWTKESLPKPRDSRVTLETTPAAKFAVIRFSGFWRDALLRQKTGELRAYIERYSLTACSAPIYAFYNPPWTLPFFRRNEVMIEVRVP